jgi:CubicO group peptidase (beta-lactamase class C family)
MGSHAHQIIGKTGLTGCAVMVNREKGIAMALLSNYVHPQRKQNADAINRVRRAVADLVFDAP